MGEFHLTFHKQTLAFFIKERGGGGGGGVAGAGAVLTTQR